MQCDATGLEKADFALGGARPPSVASASSRLRGMNSEKVLEIPAIVAFAQARIRIDARGDDAFRLLERRFGHALDAPSP